MSPTSSADSPDLGPTLLGRDRLDDDANELEDNGRARMTFLEHLDELRRRIVYSLYAVVAGCAVTFYFVDRLSQYMLAYFAGYTGKLIATQLTEGFMFDLKVGAFAGLILASPFVFSQFWLFIAPGLYAREKKVMIPFVLSATVLFSTGVWFNHRFAFPSMAKFFASFTNEYLQVMPSISITFSFYTKMAIGLGLIFEMPMLVFFLARFGIVTAKFLMQKTKYAILLIFVVAAVITPSPDFMTQLIFAAPMVVLYAVSIGVAWVFGKKKKPARI